MHRQLLRQEPEVIAVIAKNEETFRQWQKENDFEDLPGIRWVYIRGKYSVMGMRFTMIFLVEDFWRTKDFGLLSRLIQENMGSQIRTFSTLEGIKHNFERR